MKKTTFFSLLMSVIANYTSAQITITQADMPAPGDMVFSYSDTLGPINLQISAGGPNQNWDFSNGWAVRPPAATSYIQPNGLSGFATFPTSNLATTSTSNGVTFEIFYQSSPAAFSLLGYSYSGGFINALATTNQYISLPITYGQVNTYQLRSVSTTYYTLPGFYANRNISNKNVTTTCDAWGTLTIPTGTAPVLRIKSETNFAIDSSFIDSTNTGNNFQLTNVSAPPNNSIGYDFYRNGSPFSMMSLKENISSGLIDLSTYTSATSTQAISAYVPTEVKSYPNPASNQIHISNENLQATSIRIRDLHGKTAYQCSALGNQRITIHTEGLSNGLYLMEIVDANGLVIGSGKCIVQK
ncbi:MAG: T9SS type A sorting domain-containing protein [Bacteroidota bacterium]|jgi:hypothetical protein